MVLLWDTCAGCYLRKLNLDRIAREKSQLLDGLADDEVMEITPERLVEEIERHNETLRECKKHIEMHIAR